MASAPKIAAILMASGRGKRFGANKLLVEFEGRPLIERILDNVPAERFFRTIVVTRYAEIAVAAAERRFSIVENTMERDEASDTIGLGLGALPPGIDGALFLVCDQPNLKPSTIARLCEAYCETPDRIIAPVCGGNRGNPVIFPNALFNELRSLPAGKAGGFVIASHQALLRLVEFDDPTEFYDVDTPEDLSLCKGGR